MTSKSVRLDALGFYAADFWRHSEVTSLRRSSFLRRCTNETWRAINVEDFRHAVSIGAITIIKREIHEKRRLPSINHDKLMLWRAYYNNILCKAGSSRGPEKIDYMLTL